MLPTSGLTIAEAIACFHCGAITQDELRLFVGFGPVAYAKIPTELDKFMEANPSADPVVAACRVNWQRGTGSVLLGDNLYRLEDVFNALEKEFYPDTPISMEKINETNN